MTPGLFQQAHAARARRGRQADPLGQLQRGQARVGLQRGDDLPVDVVEGVLAWISAFRALNLAIIAKTGASARTIICRFPPLRR